MAWTTIVGEWFIGSLAWTILCAIIGFYIRSRSEYQLPLFSTVGAIFVGSLALGATVVLGPRLFEPEIAPGITKDYLLGAALSCIMGYILLGFWLPRMLAVFRGEDVSWWSDPDFMPSWWKFFVLPLHVAGIVGILGLVGLLLFE